MAGSALDPFNTTDQILFAPIMTADDYVAAAQVVNQVWPDDQFSAEELQHDDHMYRVGGYFARWGAWRAGQAVGQTSAAYVTWQEAPDKYRLTLDVLPAYQGQGVGRVLYRHLLANLAARAPQTLMAITREDQTRGLHFLRARGFAQVQRDPVSRLDLSQFEVEKVRESAEKVAALITIRPLSLQQTLDPGWREAIYALHMAVRLDMPGSAPKKPIPFDQYCQRLSGPAFEPDLWWLALAGDDYVGFSFLEVSANEPHKLYTGVTGVRRDYRRRGVATALKLAGFAAARQRGVSQIQTDNEESNPMYDLNMALGFQPSPAWLTLEAPFAVAAR